MKPIDKDHLYDNRFVKPNNIDYNHSTFSIVVLFLVNKIWYYGQYNYESNEWTTLPGDTLKRSFHDRQVSSWMIEPNHPISEEK